MLYRAPRSRSPRPSTRSTSCRSSRFCGLPRSRLARRCWKTSTGGPIDPDVADRLIRSDPGQPPGADRVRRQLDPRTARRERAAPGAAAGAANAARPVRGTRTRATARRPSRCCCLSPQSDSAIPRCCIAPPTRWACRGTKESRASKQLVSRRSHPRRASVIRSFGRRCTTARRRPSAAKYTRRSPTRSSATTTSTGAVGISVPPPTAPDEDIAEALECSAARVFQRGGTHAAAEFVMRAADLTPDPERRIDRLLAAVRMRSAEGDGTRAQPLLDGVMARVRDDRQRAEAEWTQGLIWLGAGRAHDAMRVLARAVSSIEQYDDGMPLHALITAENAALYAESLCDGSLTGAVAATALRLLPNDASLEPAEELVRGIAIRLTDGYAAAAPIIRAALAGLRERAENDDGARLMPDAHEHGAMLHLLAVNAACALLDDVALDLATRSWVDFGRRTRTLTTLPIAFDLRSVCDVFAGRFRAAEIGNSRGRRHSRLRRRARPHRRGGRRPAAPRGVSRRRASDVHHRETQVRGRARARQRRRP